MAVYAQNSIADKSDAEGTAHPPLSGITSYYVRFRQTPCAFRDEIRPRWVRSGIAVVFTKHYLVDQPLKQAHGYPIGCTLPHKCVGTPDKSALQQERV
jgi:hypothetical protein